MSVAEITKLVIEKAKKNKQPPAEKKPKAAALTQAEPEMSKED